VKSELDAPQQRGQRFAGRIRRDRASARLIGSLPAAPFDFTMSVARRSGA
jgi:hypothetical protein